MLAAGLITAGLNLTQAATSAPPPEAPPIPTLPDYLDPPKPPTPRAQVRPRQIPVPASGQPAVVPQPAATSEGAPTGAAPFPLVFAEDTQAVKAAAGATNVLFAFHFTNASPEAVTLQRVRTSCGCTTASLPEMPWTVAGGEAGAFDVTMDIRGKRGQVSKMVYVYTDKGFKSLTVRAEISQDPSMSDAERLRNLQLAVTDRQAVFRGDCARCHATPARNKQGRALFQAVCAVCHEAENRAEMVPDLRALKPTPGPDHWRQWITHGKAETLMPAFARNDGGPLTPEQIDSLVDYLSNRATLPQAETLTRPAADVPTPNE